MNDTRRRQIEVLRRRLDQAEVALASLEAERARLAEALKACMEDHQSERAAALLRRQDELGLKCHHLANFKQVLLCRLYIAEMGGEASDARCEPADWFGMSPDLHGPPR